MRVKLITFRYSAALVEGRACPDDPTTAAPAAKEVV